MYRPDDRRAFMSQSMMFTNPEPRQCSATASKRAARPMLLLQERNFATLGEAVQIFVATPPFCLTVDGRIDGFEI